MILETFNDKTITSKQHNSLTNLSQLASMLDDPAAKNYDIVDAMMLLIKCK